MKQLIFLVVPLLFLNCGGSSKSASESISNPITERKTRREPVKPLKKIEVNQNIANIGDRLFHDAKLSGNGTVSCASCHNIETAGVDNLQFSKGINEVLEGVNTPTVINSAYNFRQFWNGRALNLKEQAEGPLLNTDEMGNNWESILNYLKSDNEYEKAFSECFEKGLTQENILAAISEFEKTLVFESRFDDYLYFQEEAITDQELEGYNLFKNYGCVSCHNGINIGGGMYQKFGLAGNYFKDRGNINEFDYGLFNVTKKEIDRFYFKVPSLRNVAKTYPYFHDGSVKTLKDAINTMARYQLGNPLDSVDVQKIELFLNTLTSKRYEK